MLHQIRNVQEESFFEGFDQNFSIVLPNGSSKDLIEDGAETKVTFETKDSYVNLAIQALLHTADKQAAWVRSGVEMVCGKLNLALLYWKILEERACGPPNIDISYLKANTRICVSKDLENGANEIQGLDSEMVKMFWQVLESFNQSERVKYLQFVSGRGKLPINMS